MQSLAGGLGASAAAVATSAATSAAPAGDPMAELRALNAHFVHNYVTNNVQAHDALLHPQFVCINPTGERIERARYLKGWATAFNADRIPYWDTRDELITLIGDIALLRATNKHVVRRPDGTEHTGMTTYTDTYVREGGRWRCVEAHMTTVAPAYYPPDSTIISVYLRGVLQPKA